MVCDKEYKVNNSEYDDNEYCSIDCKKFDKFKNMIKIPLSLDTIKKHLDIIIEDICNTEYDADYEFDTNDENDIESDDDEYITLKINKTFEFYDKFSDDEFNDDKFNNDELDESISKTYYRFIKYENDYNSDNIYQKRLEEKKLFEKYFNETYYAIDNPQFDIRSDEVGMSRGISSWYDDDE
jgi:hypothetical protein